MNRQKNLFCSGSYTIEAAFIVPIILGIVFAWMIQLFYFHDQVILNGVLKEVMIQEQIPYGQQKQEQVKLAKNQLQERLWILKVTKYKRTRKALHIQYVVESEAGRKILLTKSFLGNMLHNRIDNQCFRVQTDQLLRRKRQKEQSNTR